MGHEVLTLYDPIVVVDSAVAFKPDLMFMDIGMPLLNGYALAEKLRAESWPGTHRPRLIALTGWGQDEDRRRSQQAVSTNTWSSLPVWKRSCACVGPQRWLRKTRPLRHDRRGSRRGAKYGR